ncbi:MAG: crosslink repair DNA glycosylase YcaQ family protein [Mizugakiibacter sp.]|uniref:winged helix-turn-helix domain-containing protein n=1 Tax=Mizugakiibacter sp. TaxID=1972610 RepID=UPI0031BDBB56|nr:winged helix DNA-binding domain-containing protein [Xanthomonadaceae bacterium]
MPPILTFSAAQARLLHLAAQGLLARPRAKARPETLLRAIVRMQLLQIDTIHVVARSPYLVLFSRVGAYPPEWLDALLAEGQVFECWAHEACFAPMADWALHHAHRAARAQHWAHRHARRMHAEHREGMDRLLAHVRERGPVRAADFGRADTAAGGWWGWKAEKRWLEAWFALGELMIARRERFQRVYDVRERVLAKARPDPTAQPAPSAAEARHAWILRSVQALGVTQARWIADYFRLGRRIADADLQPLLAEGALLPVEVRGWDAPGYVHAAQRERAERAAAGALRATRTALLSPFDPVVWDRERARAMFGFDYTLECYTPAPKRRYGYFVLPILHRGRLVGRLDAKAHRGEGVFEVRSLHLEEGVAVESGLAAALAATLRDCAAWHATPRVEVRRSEPRAFAALLRAALKDAVGAAPR